MLEIVLFIAYLVFFSWLVTRMDFFRATGIDKKILIALFLYKVLNALAYGWFYGQPQYDNKADTWQFFYMSQHETAFLFTDPVGFVKDLFSYGYESSGNLFSGVDSYWNDLKTNAFTKFLGLINVFTGASYWVDLVWLNFIYFFGPVAFYRIITKKVNARQFMLIIAVFCIPSFVFWQSGLHKDGLIFLTLSMILYHFNTMVEQQKIRLYPALLLLFFLLVLFAFRNYLVLLLIPALFTWWLAEKFPRHNVLNTVIIYGACMLLFFMVKYISPSLDFPQYMVSKQGEFRSLEANSQVALPVLQPSFAGFIAFLPYALDMTILRPHVTELANPAYWPSIAENLVLWTWLLWALINKLRTGIFRKPSPVSGLVICCCCFGISLLLLTGYTVTAIAGVVRYKSLVLPMLFAPLAGVKKSQ